MKVRNSPIWISLTCLIMAVFLLSPSFIKLVHALNEHKDIECKSAGELHIHDVELDCDFDKFNLSPQLYTKTMIGPKRYEATISKKKFSQYTFLSKYQKLHFTLRGPPMVS